MLETNMFTIAIIGRPNVGKSTLFNRLTGKRHALVHDLPGVTRDRREGEGRVSDISFNVIDTPGLEEADAESLEGRMMLQTEAAVEEADVCLMVLDGRAGITASDQFFAEWIRKRNAPVIVVVNKCEGERGDAGFHEALGLGFDATLPFSAEHGLGLSDLYEVLTPFYESYIEQFKSLDNDENETEGPLKIAIIGRPNSGKSTLINSFLGKERMLTGPEAGITRDSVGIQWEYNGRAIQLIDTAGVRRKANVKQKLEKLSVADTLRALRFCHVAIVLMDATAPLEKQDLAIIEMAIREGRAVIIGFNKWDLVKGKDAHLKELRYQVDSQLPQIAGVNCVTLSALHSKRVNSLIEESFAAYDMWNKRISTAKLNEWLKDAESRHLPPLGKNRRRIRLKYITQGNVRPPTYTLFSNLPKDIPDSYRRYLIHSLRDAFDLQCTPVRMMLRKSDNPYKD